ncbi:hypothetical protein WN943_011010 [Citrus x changshan-huyou]
MGDEILMEDWRLYLTFFWTHEKAKEGRLAAKNRSLLTLQVLPISLAITRYQRSCFSKTEAVKVLWMAKSTILVTSAGGRTACYCIYIYTQHESGNVLNSSLTNISSWLTFFHLTATDVM